MSLRREDSDVERGEVPKAELHSPSLTLALWGNLLLFFDALAGALFLPVLPALARRFGVSSDAAVAAWVGLLVFCYYAGRSGTLSAVRALSLNPPEPGPVKSAAVVVAAVSIYFLTGMVTTASIGWLSPLRAAAGMLGAAQHLLGVSCLDLAVGNHRDRSGRGDGEWDPVVRDAPAAAAGIVVGALLGGLLYIPGNDHPLLAPCLIAILLYAGAGAGVAASALGKGLTVPCKRRRYAGLDVDSGGSGGGDGGGGCGGGDAIGSSSDGTSAGIELAEGPCDDAACDAAAAAGAAETAAPATGAAPELAAAVTTATAPPLSEIVGPVHGPDKIPVRYLRGCNGDEEEATRRWRATLDWRREERVDAALNEAQPHFALIKRHYPHFVHRRALNGCPVYYEQLGKVDLKTIWDGGVTMEAMRRHYLFITEYIWSVVEPDFDHGQLVTVLDVSGLGMADMGGEAFGFMKQATKIIQEHYVERSNKLFVVNAPSYFSLVWKGIRPMLNENTQAKITILGKRGFEKELQKYIAVENIPKEYGGTCPLALGESEEEQAMRDYVERINAAAAAAGCISTATTAGTDPAGSGWRAPGAEVEEVEVQLFAGGGGGGGGGGGDGGGGAGGGSNSGGIARGNEADKYDENGDPIITDGQVSGSTARRVLGRVGNVFGWAGSAIGAFRQQVPRAHLGHENRYYYDTEKEEWVMRSDCFVLNRQASSLGDGPDRDPNNEEEMTVLAIQAAQRARLARNSQASVFAAATTSASNEGDERTQEGADGAAYSMRADAADRSLVANDELGPSRGANDGDHRGGGDGGDSGGSSGAGGQLRAGGEGTVMAAGVAADDDEEAVMPWSCGPALRAGPGLSVASLWYILLVATREALPVVAFLEVSRGGLGLGTAVIGIALAAAGGGMGASWAGVFGKAATPAALSEAPQGKLPVAVLRHVPVVAVLAVLSPLAGVGLPKVLCWLVFAAGFFLNQTCVAQARASKLSACRDHHAEGAAAWMDCRSLLLGDVA
ncbi:unnamed protein product, partial [Phaeothamnion confervicola]